MRERSSAEETLKEFERVESEVRDLLDLLELVRHEQDDEAVGDKTTERSEQRLALAGGDPAGRRDR